MRIPIPLLAALVAAASCAPPTCPADLVDGLRRGDPTALLDRFHGDPSPSAPTVLALADHLRIGRPGPCFYDGDEATVHVRFERLDPRRESFRRSLRGRIDRHTAGPGEVWILHAVRRAGTWRLDWDIPVGP